MLMQLLKGNTNILYIILSIIFSIIVIIVIFIFNII